MIMREENYEDEAKLFDNSSKENFGRSMVDKRVKAERITDEMPQDLPTIAPEYSDAADDAANYRRARGRARIF